MLVGDAIDSRVLEFHPAMPPQPGHYHFDVGDAAQGGSAGAVTLIFQAILWPLLFAGGRSQMVLRGGTHVSMSPPWHYLAHVARLAFGRIGATFSTELEAWGWYPVGGGAMTAAIEPVARLDAPPFEYVPVERVEGIAAVTNLPADIPQRIAGRAANLLSAAGLRARIEPRRENGAGPGAGIFLWLPQGGFSALGRRGLPADQVAEAAVAETLAFVDNTAMVDRHLADQLLLPLALAHGRTRYTTDHLTLHTVTNADLLQQWLDTRIDITGDLGGPAEVDVNGAGFVLDQHVVK
jgi:RNA 3'-terminal phosphate cyclase (ATP)